MAGPRDRSGISALFAAGGAMGELMARTDWADSPIGEPETWPQSLRTALSVCLESRFPMLIWWGPELVMLYNDAYRPILGATKHPAAMGRRGRETWPEIWDVIGPMLDGVVGHSDATWSEDQLLLMDRNGYEEETYFTFSYSPIRDETGSVGGVFTAVFETTDRVLGERRLACLRALADARGGAASATAAAHEAMAVLAENTADVPFAALYPVNEDGAVGAAPIATASVAPPRTYGWPLAAAAASREPVQGDGVLVLPVRGGRHGVAALLACGVNPLRALDDDYRAFLRLVAGEIATSMAAATAREEDRRRAEALAGLDEAKTAFFSNVSHEFRTPLTLLLGPLEELLAGADPLTVRQRAALEQCHRNGLRMLRLVNALLDFSRVGAGRLRPELRTVDLARYTTELAGAFHSAVVAAGLELIVDCPPLPRQVIVDPGMWEKVVLNLLSNALKHTWTGTITVSLAAEPDGIRLTVSDTGTGIPAEELPHLFERFHRVPDAHARSSEGAGIGLALVDELVRLHGGRVEIDSTMGAGSRFSVTMPYQPEGAEAAQAPAPEGEPRDTVAPFLAEAELWTSAEAPDAPTGAGPRVLLVDDNPDMREYVGRLLGADFDLATAADGVAALESIRDRMPDVVLTDVMMPRLDGFGLVRALREDPRTERLPVIVLSARAGEEASVEGLEAGADDYLVKPFTQVELIARVNAALKSHRAHEAVTHAALRYANRLHDLAEAGLRIATPLDPAAVLERVAAETLRLLGATAASAADEEGRRADAGEPAVSGAVLHRRPLRADEDREVGILEVESPAPLDDADRAVLDQLALLGGGALERARLHAREHATVELLQRSLLPEELPEVPGVQVAVRYLPASTAAEVGGDWYDVVPLPDDRLGVVVGDVVGHGLGAAATMSHLRNVLRAYLSEGLSPGVAVARMHELVQRTGEGLTATLCCLVLDPARDVALVARAGHPSPVLVPAGGPPELLGDEDGLSPALGVPLRAEPVECELRLGPGGTLLLYTDGLVERRDRDLYAGIEQLAALAAGGDADLDAYADAIVDGLLGESPRSDDVALLVLRRSADAEPVWETWLPAWPESLAELRIRLRGWLLEQGAGGDDIDAILVAANEALANAIEHAGLSGGQRISVRARIAGGSLYVTLRDSGRWRTPSEPGMRGHGLPLMRALTDAVEVDVREDGTRVELRLELGVR